jgi:hypothetical protein
MLPLVTPLIPRSQEMNNNLYYRIFGAVFLIVTLGACSSVSVKTETPTPQAQSILKPNIISGVEVSIAPMHEDRIKLLQKKDIPNLIKKSMTESLKNGGYISPTMGTYRCMVEILNFVQNKFIGGTQVTLKVSIRDKSNTTVKEFTSSSASIRSGPRGMSATFSDAVQKALNHL